MPLQAAIFVCVGMACLTITDTASPDGYATEAECVARLEVMSVQLPEILGTIFGVPVDAKKINAIGRCMSDAPRIPTLDGERPT